MLDYNGYSFRISGSVILFKKGHDYVGVGIVAFLSILLIPLLFSIGILIGFLFMALVTGGITFYFKRFSKFTKLTLDSSKRNIIFQSTKEKRRLLYRHVNSVFLHSKFKSEYSSAFKSTNEEHTVTLGVQLNDGVALNLFTMISDYAEPSKEMKEVARYLESTLKTSPNEKNKPAV